MEYDYLYIYTNNIELYNCYVNHIENHNKSVLNSKYPNAGFDLLNPNNIQCDVVQGKVCLNTEIVCSMNNYYKTPLSYYLYPRSSISKTSLRFANSVGIIDSGYRGNIMAMFDIIQSTEIVQNQRLVQICSPTLKPLVVYLVDSLEELGHTERGNGGFGSSGK